jgi:hypothetical protein
VLRQGYGEVQRLYRDIRQAVVERRDWNSLVFAPRVLGDHVPVEAWYLAEHFLLAWSDWRGLKQRYIRYFGRREESLPQTWRRVDKQCQRPVEQLLRERELDSIVSQSWSSWKTPLMRSALAGEPPLSHRSLYHDIVSSHRRTLLVAEANSAFRSDALAVQRPKSAEPYWPQAFEAARELNTMLFQQWGRISREVRTDTAWHLRCYQHATLSLSWLLRDSTAQTNGWESPLIAILSKENPVIPSIEQFLSSLTGDAAQRSLAGRVLNRIQTAINEIGFDDFVADVTSGEFVGGNSSLVGADRINVLPGAGNDVCCPILLAVSQGEKRAVGFPSAMRAVREHLIRCVDRTRVVVVLCDFWRPGMLDDHIGDLRAHYSRGVRFLFLLAGTPGRAVAPVAVDLAVGP